MKQEIKELIGISDRIAVLNINIPGYQKMWTIIQVYAPTEQAAENETKAFYDELTLTVTKFSHNHIILMGDFNAQIGKKQSKDEHVLGNFGQGRRSPNGELLVEFLLENNLKILNSLFKKNKKNKWTWISPDGSYKNEIDFVATSYPKAFTDTSVITKFNFNTNHRMVRSSLSTESPRKSRKHIGMLNAEQHSSKTLEKIADSLCKIRKEITENRNTDVLVKYGKLEKLITQHAKVDFSRENKYKLTDTTLKLIEERKNLLSKHPKKENIKLVTELSKKIKENIRKDRKNKRQQTLENHIKRTGGVKKALKELREIDKEWIPKLKNEGITSSNRNSVNKMATIFYKEIVKSKEISMSTKRKVFNTCILPVITYGCETWSLTKLHRQKLQRCQRAMERSMTGNRIQDRVRSSVIRERTNVVDILTRIDQQKWRWTGHMIRDPHNKWSTIVSDWYPRDGKRNRGRQQMRWEDDLKFTAGHHWRRVARDRTQWKMLEEAYANRHTELRDIL
ncbi:hypothetical protein B5X24_HaOG215613 [Helicoverpa armigera]|nr:hypothetical protein B5X24_HaOG215613 [Helicoverpa armigera]